MLRHYKPSMLAKLRLTKGPPQAVKEITLSGAGFIGIINKTNLAAKGDLVIFKSNDTYVGLEFALAADNTWRVRPWNLGQTKVTMWGHIIRHWKWYHFFDGAEVELTFNQGINLKYRFTFFSVPFTPALVESVQVAPNAILDESMLMQPICSRNIKTVCCVSTVNVSRFTTEPFKVKRIGDGVVLVPVPSLCNEMTFVKNFNEFAKAVVKCINLRMQKQLLCVLRFRGEIDLPRFAGNNIGRSGNASRLTRMQFSVYFNRVKMHILEKFMSHLRCVICAKHLCNARTLKCAHVSCEICYKNVGKYLPNGKRIICPCQIKTSGFLLVASTPYLDEIRKKMEKERAYFAPRARLASSRETAV